VSVVERGEGGHYDFEGQAVEKLFVFIRSLKAQAPLANQRLWGSAPNPGVFELERGDCRFSSIAWIFWMGKKSGIGCQLISSFGVADFLEQEDILGNETNGAQ
jgi:hypothetical protein